MADLLESLTNREREILTCLVNDLSNAEIAAQLHLSPQTVRWYNSQIYSKLGAKNRREAIAKATARGWLEDSQSVDPISHNLPAQTTPFTGREKELNELAQLFTDDHVRLITIFAPGGVGKTRLALATAAQLIKRKNTAFGDGIFFVALQPLSDPQYIVSQIANSIGFQFGGDNQQPKEQLLGYLATQKILLLMDNWEHLLEGLALITEIMHAAPYVRILATSREKLNLSGETVFSLKGMSFPTWETPEDALQYDAVQLLIQSAQRVKPDWIVTQDNLDAVLRVCRLTQGVPLGIVLAASWLDTLSLEEVAHEIQQSLDFLVTEMRDMPERQRSIRIIFEQTWRRLSQIEQLVFMKLSVFHGGFTRQAAQAVAGADARVLQTLVNKALISRDTQGRYDVHELLRQYAEEQLIESGEAEATYDAHLRYFADFVQQRDVAFKSHAQDATVHELEADFENIRKMWNGAIETRHQDVYYRTAETLCWYGITAPHLPEAEALFQTACTALEARWSNMTARQTWCHLRLRFMWIQIFRYGYPGPYDETIQSVKQWLEIAQAAGNKTDSALCYCFLGVLAVLAGHNNAMPLLEESLRRFQVLEDHFYSAWTLHFLCFAWEETDIETCIAYQRQALDIWRELGDPYGLGLSLFNVAVSVIELGDLEEGEMLAQQMLDLTLKRQRYSWVSTLIAEIAFLRGDFELVREESIKSFEAFSILKQTRIKAFSLMKLGLVACIDGDYAEALECYEQAQLMSPSPHHWFYLNWLLALAACGLRDYVRAVQASHDALSTSIRKGATGRIIWCLPAVVMIETHRGNYAQAVQLLSLAFHHPKSATGWLEKWPLISQIQDDLKTELGVEAYEMVWDRGKHLELEQAVEDWLSLNA